MTLKDLPKTTIKTAEWTKHRRKFEATLTTNGHQHDIDKILRIPDTIGDNIKYYKYKTDNDLVLSVLDLLLVETSLHDRVDKHRLTNDGISVFIDIDV